MLKLLNYLRFMAQGAACALLLTMPAAAQQGTNTQLAAPALLQNFGASDVSSMLAEFNITSALQPYNGDGTGSMIARTDGGAMFIITMMQCSDPAAATGCTQAVVYTGMSNSGLAYDDLNTFHTNSNVTRAVNIPDQQMIVFGTPIFTQGGIGREHFQLLTALFLNDMQQYVQGQLAAGTSVSLEVQPHEGGKTDNMTADSSEHLESSQLKSASLPHALKAAVSNTQYVNFLSDEAAAFVD